jgi:hypothetical protein
MMHHYTNRKGHNAIRARQPWRFLARKPRGSRPVGAYFTGLRPETPKLAKRLRVPRSKVKFVFVFTDRGDLQSFPGGRGDYIFFSPRHYDVERARQRYEGPT